MKRGGGNSCLVFWDLIGFLVVGVIRGGGVFFGFGLMCMMPYRVRKRHSHPATKSSSPLNQPIQKRSHSHQRPRFISSVENLQCLTHPLLPPPTSNRQLRSSIPPTLINTLLHPLPTPLKEKIQRIRIPLIGAQPHGARRDLRAGRRILRLGPADRHGGAPAAGGTGGGLDGGDGEGGCLVGEPALGVGDGGVGGEDEGGEGGVWVVEVRKG